MSVVTAPPMFSLGSRDPGAAWSVGQQSVSTSSAQSKQMCGLELHGYTPGQGRYCYTATHRGRGGTATRLHTGAGAGGGGFSAHQRYFCGHPLIWRVMPGWPRWDGDGENTVAVVTAEKCPGSGGEQSCLGCVHCVNTSSFVIFPKGQQQAAAGAAAPNFVVMGAEPGGPAPWRGIQLLWVPSC